MSTRIDIRVDALRALDEQPSGSWLTATELITAMRRLDGRRADWNPYRHGARVRDVLKELTDNGDLVRGRQPMPSSLLIYHRKES